MAIAESTTTLIKKRITLILKNDYTDKHKATSKNVIPAKAGIQKRVIILDSRLRGSDKFGIIRGSLKSVDLIWFLRAYKKMKIGLMNREKSV